MMTIVYPIKNKLYLNITNHCPCRCNFCLRHNDVGVQGSDPLWLDHEPSYQEILDALNKWNLNQYEELVFCGYGEPTERLDVLLDLCHHIRSLSTIPIRLNTIGLSDLIHNRSTAQEFHGLIDTVSISLNTNNPEEFLAMTNSKFGINSYSALLAFAKDCTIHIPQVILTVVDKVCSVDVQKECGKIANSMGATLRIRPFE